MNLIFPSGFHPGFQTAWCKNNVVDTQTAFTYVHLQKKQGLIPLVTDSEIYKSVYVNKGLFGY
ncbi:MAG: hypothetical protein C0403_11110 [Desulfobacterium sp.]|nr:hypothetical protein [Desulfobacterium sp.]